MGNISVVTCERIYHMPSQHYYDETVVNPAKGDRWFSSQWEAWWAVGWMAEVQGDRYHKCNILNFTNIWNAQWNNDRTKAVTSDVCV